MEISSALFRWFFHLQLIDQIVFRIADLFRTGDNEQSFDDVFQLPYIAGPVVMVEAGNQRVGDSDVGSIFQVQSFQKKTDQGQDIIAPVSQRRDVDRDDAQTVEEVAPECGSIHEDVPGKDWSKR